MRRVSIVVTCDSCMEEIEEETEGSAAVRFTVRGEERELDLCDLCLSGTFLQESRSVNNRKKKAKDFTCPCGRAFATQRGLSRHQTAAHDGVV